MQLNKCIPILCLLLFAPSVTEAATYYVDHGCGSVSTYVPATRACTGGNALSRPTIAGGVELMSQSGDILEVRAGTYSGDANTLIIDNLQSGTPSAYTIVRGYQSERPRVTSTYGAYVTVQRDYIEINRFEYDGSFQCFQGTAATGPARPHHYRWLNNICHDTLSVGMQTGGTVTDMYIAGNEFYRIGTSIDYSIGVNTFYGIGARSIVEHNIVHDSVAGIFVYCSNCTNIDQSNVIIRNNLLYNMGRDDLYPMMTSAAVQSFNGPALGCGSECPGIEIYNNIIYNSKPGPGLISLYTSYTGNGKIYNNTIYNRITAGASNVGGPLYVESNGSTTVVRNNLIYNFSGSVNLASGTTSSNNLNTTNDPGFANAAGGDFSLTSGSVAIDAGTATGLPAGRFSNGLPDQGAHETFGCSTASAFANTVELTCQMSGYTPILPATGQTTWVVKFGGVARNTVSAVRKPGTDSVVQITYDGAACANTDTMTVDFTSGNVTDSALIGNTKNQKLHSFTALAVNESNCTGGGGGPPPGTPEIIYDMNDISGTTVPDTSGNANDGTTSGSPSVVTGLIDDALDFADQVDDFITAPWGSGLDPTTQSATVCILVSPDSTSNERTYFGPPQGTDQRGFLTTYQGTWTMGIQANTYDTNNDFPVQSGWQFPCIVWDASTDTATLWVNAVKGTSAQSVKAYTSHVWDGNFTFGKASGFFTSTAPGGVIDHIVVYESALNQTEMTELYESLVSPSPPPAGTISIAGGRFMSPRRTEGGGTEYIAALNTSYQVRPGGYFAVDFQIDGEDEDPDPFSARLHYETDASGSVFAVPDTAPENGLQFYGSTSDSSLAVDSTIDYSLTGSFDIVNGSTQVTSAAIPSVDLDVDTSTVLRYILRVPATATPGTEHCLTLLNQSGQPLGSHTPAGGLCLTVSQPSANGF